MLRTVLAALLAALLVAGCTGGKRVPAIGPGYEIIVLSSAKTRSLGTAVAEILSKEIRVVHFEETFTTVEDPLTEFDFYKTRKLLFVIGEPGDAELEKVLDRATGTRSRSPFPGLWIEVEPFSAGQVMFILTGPLDALTDQIIQNHDVLLETVEEAATTLLLTNLYRAGEVEGARERMLQLWGWGVRLPPEWVVDEEFAEHNFVRVWHDAPVEQLFVSWENGLVDRTPEEWLERRDDLVERFYDGDRVVRGWTIAREEATPFHGDGVFLMGLWENNKYVIGGPFRSWAFQCPHDGRTYLIDYSVYAPDRPKRHLLRVLEAVGRTFRCGCVPLPGGESS